MSSPGLAPTVGLDKVSNLIRDLDGHYAGGVSQLTAEPKSVLSQAAMQPC
jgi:hypothetical protein